MNRRHHFISMQHTVCSGLSVASCVSFGYNAFMAGVDWTESHTFTQQAMEIAEFIRHPRSAYLVLFESLPSGDGGAARVAVRAEQPVIVRPEAPPGGDSHRPRVRALPPPARGQLGQLDGVTGGTVVWRQQLRRRWRMRGGGGRRGAGRVERRPWRRGRRRGRHAEHGADRARPQVVDRLGLIVTPPPPPLPKRVVLGGARLRVWKTLR